MPNFIANVALIAWLLVGVLAFRRCTPAAAATIAFLGAHVVLPANMEWQFAGFPGIDRNVIGGWAALLGWFCHARARRALGRFAWLELLVAIQVLGAFGTMLTNSDSLRYGANWISGVRLYDGLSVAFEKVSTVGIGVFLGQRVIRSFADVEQVFRVIVAFGLCYVPLIMWEVRMSPQLHTDLYGYFPHSFGQHLRADGFRPVVFTSHGLEVALFMATATIAAFGLYRARLRLRQIASAWAFTILLGGLALCKSTGSFLYGSLSPMFMALRAHRLQACVLVALVGMVTLYPVLRAQQLFPTEVLVDATAALVSPQRAQSLHFRFANEDILLAKASQRLWLGWGTYGRHHVYGLDRVSSTTDGHWIITIGQFGLVGFLTLFALLLTPVVVATKRLLRMRTSQQRALLLALTMLVLVRAVDFLPNCFPSPFTFFLAGALVSATAIPLAAGEPRPKMRASGTAMRRWPRRRRTFHPARPTASPPDV